MRVQQERGNAGERVAAGFLRSLGYEILEMNWRAEKREIDIIARIEATIVFVEVKSRGEEPLDDPVLAVNRRKQKHMIQAAQQYMERTGCPLAVRYDIITVRFTPDGPVIEHMPDAFCPMPI